MSNMLSADRHKTVTSPYMRFGQQRRAFQRVLGVSDEVLADVQGEMARQVAWGIEQA